MISPIEMQMIVHNTEPVGNVKHHEHTKTAVEGMQITSQVEKEVKQNGQMVIPKEQNQFPEYRYDASEEGRNKYENSKKKRKAEKKEAEKNDEEGQCSEITRVNFDIKI